MKKSEYNLSQKKLLKLIKKKGILIERKEKGADFLFDKRIPYGKELGAVPVKNIWGNITNVYVVYEDVDGTIKYYDYPMFTEKEIKKLRQKHEERISLEKLYIVAADNGCVYAVKATSKQKSLDLVLQKYNYSAEEVASKELESEIFKVLGDDCKIAMIN